MFVKNMKEKINEKSSIVFVVWIYFKWVYCNKLMTPGAILSRVIFNV